MWHVNSDKASFWLEELLENNVFKNDLSDVQMFILKECLLGSSYQQIADRSGYDYDYIKHTGAKLWRSLSQTLDKKVTKNNVRTVLSQYLSLPEFDTDGTTITTSIPKQSTSVRDWGDAVDVTCFVGRETEIERCQSWIIKDRCRLLMLLGMGGVGKTTFAAKLARDVAGEFEYVIWRSLRNSPPFAEWLMETILFVSDRQEINLSASIEQLINSLMQYLSASRCLLILDNAESILRSGEIGGLYRQEYEGYGQLLRRLADENHQSCLIVTSREQPIGIGSREGNLVRSLKLSGLSASAAREIIKVKVEADRQKALEPVADYQKLVEQYRGNPLAIKIATTTIEYIFGGNVAEFLASGIIVYGDIWDLLEQQFNRLSKEEQAVMYWLAINREAVTLSQLIEDIVPIISARNLLEILESLQRRSLIEASILGFTQQPVVMEYITEKVIDIFEIEIRTGKIDLLRTHAIVKAETKDYLRQTQTRLFLEPIAQRLLASLSNQQQIEQKLQAILEQLKSNREIEAQYAVGNAIDLLKFLQIDFTGWDFSHLQVWQADFRDISLQGVNFAGADLSKSVFAAKMGSVFAVDFSPDGQLLATGDEQRLKIWQMPECKLIMSLPGHDAPLFGL